MGVIKHKLILLIRLFIKLSFIFCFLIKKCDLMNKSISRKIQQKRAVKYKILKQMPLI